MKCSYRVCNIRASLPLEAIAQLYTPHYNCSSHTPTPSDTVIPTFGRLSRNQIIKFISPTIRSPSARTQSIATDLSAGIMQPKFTYASTMGAAIWPHANVVSTAITATSSRRLRLFSGGGHVLAVIVCGVCNRQSRCSAYGARRPRINQQCEMCPWRYVSPTVSPPRCGPC